MADNSTISATTLFQEVLLVEDDPSHALLIKRALKDYAANVQHVETVKQALDFLLRHKPNLIITDLNLPDSSGAGSQRLEHVSKIKNLADGVQIVVLTSSTALDDAVEAMRLGSSDFIVKDFSANFKAVLGLSLTRIAAAILLAEEKTRLEREMSALRMAIENGDDGFAIVTGDAKLLYSNRSFSAFTSLCAGSATTLIAAIGSNVKNQSQVVDSIQSAIGAIKPHSIYTTEITFIDNKINAFELRLSGINANSEGALQAVVWVKDVTERRKREKFQREILSTTTHDLKGPLGAILVSADLLQDLITKDINKARELVLRVSSAAQGAVNLIDEFLSARRIQEGNFVLRPTKQDLANLAQECLEGQGPIAAARKIDLQLHKSEGSDFQVLVDRMGFVRVLGNLLTNAFKFTARGGKVSVELHGLKDEVKVQVRDTGTGMEPSEVQKLFQRFSRLDRHKDVAGTGIGLFVVKSLVAAHGGRIEVSSRIGEGTSFDLYFPRHPSVNERGELIALDFV